MPRQDSLRFLRPRFCRPDHHLTPKRLPRLCGTMQEPQTFDSRKMIAKQSANPLWEQKIGSYSLLSVCTRPRRSQVWVQNTRSFWVVWPRYRCPSGTSGIIEIDVGQGWAFSIEVLCGWNTAAGHSCRVGNAPLVGIGSGQWSIR